MNTLTRETVLNAAIEAIEDQDYDGAIVMLRRELSVGRDQTLKQIIAITEQTHRTQERAWTALSQIDTIARAAL